MIERLSASLADVFIKSGAAREEDRDVYVYGLDVLISTAANILCMLAIGILIGRALQAALFLLFFSVLRSASGGYHADSHLVCFLILLAAFAASMALLALLPRQACLWLAPALAALSAVAVALLAPAPHPNRPVSACEIVKFRMLSRAIAGAEAAAVLLCLILNAPPAALACALGMFAPACSLCASRAQGIGTAKSKV